MLDRNVGGLPVVGDRGDLSGIVTESDFVAREKGIPFSVYRVPQMFGRWMPHEHVERIYESQRRHRGGSRHCRNGAGKDVESRASSHSGRKRPKAGWDCNPPRSAAADA